MTKDLISRKALVRALLNELNKFPPEITERYSFGAKVPCQVNQALRGGIRKALREIEMAPAVDAVPVVHGRWIEAKGAIRCSECMNTPLYDYFGKIKLSDACPHCGAKMDKEAEE